MSNISNQPRTQTLNGVVFTDAEVATLAAFFASGVPAVLAKADIVGSCVVQKSMKAAAVYSSDINSGPTASLYLTSDGYELLGLEDHGASPSPPAPITFSDGEVIELRAFFPTMDMCIATPAFVRTTPVLVKAIQAQMIQVSSAPPGPEIQVILRLTQNGRALLGPR
jgi:hypothetical protein